MIIKQQAGFTLLEVIIYMTLLSFILITTISTLYSVSDANKNTKYHAQIEESGNFILQKLSRQINTGQTITFPTTTLNMLPENININYFPISSSTRYKAAVSFSIKNHYFNLEQIMP